MDYFVDLHLHSSYSDGIHKPAELVAMAAEKGLRAIALADHDSVEGIDEALEAGNRFGVEVIPAVELSVEFTKFHDVHLLGYHINHHDRDFHRKLAEFRERRDLRGQAIIANINAMLERHNKGNISYEEATALAEGALGRPHIARILIEKGFARDMQDAFVRYLEPCDVPKLYFPMEEALAEIRRLHGIAVLAHPTSITDERKALTRVVGELAAMGLDGLEVYNNMCRNDDMGFLERLAGDLGLVMTGGSDFHGIEAGIEIGVGRGQLAVPYRSVESLKRRRKELGNL